MKIIIPSIIGAGAILTVAMMTTVGWDRPPIDAVQRGYRGLGIEHVYNPRVVDVALQANVPPAPPYEIDPEFELDEKASEFYENVEVLGDITTDRFNRLMLAVTEWVVPGGVSGEQNCNYCHNPDDLADDSKYTYQVSRRMFQMTRHINANWETHVAETGVTCYTCHRGNAVPENIYFDGDGASPSRGLMNYTAGQNIAGEQVGLTSLPTNPMAAFMGQEEEIRVIPLTALPEGPGASIQRTEWTYGLMMHFSQSLGVNCTYCHNTRSFYAWDQSPPQRTSAWHGIRLVQEINSEYLEPLQPLYPSNRLGPAGGAPKANCGTCHNGAYKPLFGANMAQDWPSLDSTPAVVQAPEMPAESEAPVAN